MSAATTVVDNNIAVPFPPQTEDIGLLRFSGGQWSVVQNFDTRYQPRYDSAQARMVFVGASGGSTMRRLRAYTSP